MQVLEHDRNRTVRWRCVAHPDEWVDTEITFALKESDGEVTLRCTQAKWKEVTDMLAFCATEWGVFLLSLKEAIESGAGRPYPHGLQTTHQ
jgi:hypothetical protein